MKNNKLSLLSLLLILIIISINLYLFKDEIFNKKPSFEESIEYDKMCSTVFKNSNFSKDANMFISYKYSISLDTCITYFNNKEIYLIYDLLNKSDIYRGNKEGYDIKFEEIK